MTNNFSYHSLTFSSLLCLLLSGVLSADAEHQQVRPPIVSPPRISTILTPAIQFKSEASESSPYSASSITIEKLLLADESGSRPAATPASWHSERKTCNTQQKYDCLDTEYSSEDDHFKEPARVLIMHPIYAGSHEVVLRSLGLEMVRRGHFVTQLKWKSDHSPIDVKRQAFQNMAPASYLNATFNMEGNSANEDGGRSMKIITVSPENEDLRLVHTRSRIMSSSK